MSTEKRVYRERESDNDEETDDILCSFKDTRISEEKIELTQRSVTIGSFFLLEDGPNVKKFTDILRPLLDDFNLLERDFTYILDDKFMNLKLSSSSIEAEVSNLKIDMLKPHPQKLSYHNKNAEDYLQFFNNYKDLELIYFLNYIIENFSVGGVILLICKSELFQSLIDLKLISDVNKNVQFHIGLTNGIVNDTVNIINNERKFYMKYNFGTPVEAMYTTDEKDNNEFSKITFHLNRKLKSMEKNSICGYNENPCFLSYEKYETDIYGEYDGVRISTEITDDKCTTWCRHYQHGKIVSEMRK